MADQRAKKAQLMASGQGDWLLRQVTSARYENFSPHHHNSYEFYLHVRGGSFLQLEQHIFPLVPYQLVIIPPHQVHGLVSSEPLRDYQRIYLQVTPQALDQMSGGSVSLRRIIDEQYRQGICQVKLSPQNYLRLRTLMSSIAPCETISSPLERMEMMGYLSAVISRICQLITTKPSQENQPFAPLMHAVYHHILEHFAQDCSLEALAEEFSINKYHLSHRFSETFGLPLHRFVLECRIAYAQQLIRQGEPLMTVFYRCGFNDYSSFVRAFSRMVGASPRAWRDQQRAPSM